MKVDLNLVSKEVAKNLSENVMGLPAENRVLLALPNEEKKVGNIILPGTVTEGIPKVGVVVKSGPITEEYKTYIPSLEVGNIIYFGNYAGKEIEPSFLENFKVPDCKFTVLSINEIIYWEPQKN